MGETILILGGARSGKSRLAEALAGAPASVTYLATSTVDPSDGEMADRIRVHRERRPDAWTTREVPRDLAGVLEELSVADGTVLVECATLWITNLMLGLGGGAALDDRAILEEVERAGRASKTLARVIWVSNEVGSGVVPENALARRFVDLQGRTNQTLAALCDQAYLCVAGLPLRLK